MKKQQDITEKWYKVDINIHFLQKQMKHKSLRMLGDGLFQKTIAMEGDKLPIIIRSEPYFVNFMKWGWKPEFYVNSKHYNQKPLLYCKGESLNTFYKEYMERPSQHRCIVIANSFYAWYFKKPQSTKHKAKGQWVREEFASPKNIFLLFAGLYGLNSNDNRETMGFSIVNKPAISSLKSYMTRMPLVLNQSDLRTWLSGSVEACMELVEYEEQASFVIPFTEPLPGDDDYMKREVWKEYYHSNREDWNDIDQEKLRMEKYKH